MAGEGVCLLGWIAGGALGLLIGYALAIPARGRTKADFVPMRGTVAEILRAGEEYLIQQGMRVERRPTGLFARSVDWSMGKRFLELRLRDHPGGVQAHVEAYMTMLFLKEVHLGPRGFVAKIPRRQFLRVVEGLLGALRAEGIPLKHEHM